MKKYLIWIMAGVLLLICCLLYPRFNGETRIPQEVTSHPFYAVFEETFDYSPISGAVADLNDDGLDDLLIVYYVDPESNKIVGLLSQPDSSVAITQSEPAPIENALIEFKDIDKTPPMEFILSGNKGSYVGYGVFRIVDDMIFNLFGSDMDDCC